MFITLEDLQRIVPRCPHPEEWVRPLNDTMQRFDISNVKRISTFLGQLAYESGEFTRLEENLNYSPRRLLEVWPERFPELKDAQGYARNPEKLANKVYADRLGNGPEYSGDGFLYRGRGLIQVTGRSNYQMVDDVLQEPDLMHNPEKLRNPTYAALSAGVYWDRIEGNDYADMIGEVAADEVVRLITQLVNGGSLGLEDRINYTNAALAALDVDFAA